MWDLKIYDRIITFNRYPSSLLCKLCVLKRLKYKNI